MVSPGAAEPGEENGRFQLRRGNRRLEHDGDRVARAGKRQRQPAVGRGERARADALQRIEHPPHRALAQRGIAVEGRRDRAAGDRSEHEPAPGSRIAEIKRGGRFGKAGDADAADDPRAGAAPLEKGAERLHRLRGVEHILAFEQSADFASRRRKRAEDQRPMRDRFIAGHAHAAAERAMAAGGERSGRGVHRENPLSRAAAPRPHPLLRGPWQRAGQTSETPTIRY